MKIYNSKFGQLYIKKIIKKSRFIQYGLKVCNCGPIIDDIIIKTLIFFFCKLIYLSNTSR